MFNKVSRTHARTHISRCGTIICQRGLELPTTKSVPTTGYGPASAQTQT